MILSCLYKVRIRAGWLALGAPPPSLPKFKGKGEEVTGGLPLCDLFKTNQRGALR